MGKPGSVVALVMNHGLILAASRRNKKDDLGLPGGKIEPGETPEQAVKRELLEETGIEAEELTFVYERVDSIDGNIAWCYRITKWKGTPRSMEPGIAILWVLVERLLDEDCTFHEYNFGLFDHLGLLI
jgi:8-oxo-dGTP diphosphatase